MAMRRRFASAAPSNGVSKAKAEEVIVATSGVGREANTVFEGRIGIRERPSGPTIDPPRVGLLHDALPHEHAEIFNTGGGGQLRETADADAVRVYEHPQIDGIGIAVEVRRPSGGAAPHCRGRETDARIRVLTPAHIGVGLVTGEATDRDRRQVSHGPAPTSRAILGPIIGCLGPPSKACLTP